MKNRIYPKLPYQLMKNQILGLICLGIFILLVQICFFFYKNQQIPLPPNAEFEQDTSQKNILTEFNPNDLDATQWQSLGFSEKQVQTILRYKNIVGGSFSNKEQLKNCYAISDKKFTELSPYILLPEKNQPKEKPTFNSNKGKTLNINRKFNPNDLSQKDWEIMGFSEKQAQTILKYKQYLGGAFHSKEDLKSCFVISEKHYRQMFPYILLNLKQKDNHQEKSKIQYVIFDPNSYDIKDWQSIGFSEKQAQVIINYRDKNLKGNFRNIEDIRNCFVISASKFEEIKPYIQLKTEQLNNNDNIKEHTNIPSVQVKTDFTKIDLNQITFKELKEFGFDDKSAGMLIGFRKKLGGFIKKEQVLETYNIDKNIAEKLISITSLNNSSVVRHTLIEAPEEWLKKHPYFRYSADKITFCRQTNTSEQDIWQCVKATPKMFEKMKLYLK